MTQIKVFHCPSNPMSNLRYNNGMTDSAGFMIADYTTLPYVEAATAPGTNQVYALLPTALTGRSIPRSTITSSSPPTKDPSRPPSRCSWIRPSST